VADRIEKGSIVADIGTDHAYLPIYLIKSGICPRVIAVEAAADPYQIAVNTVQKAGLANRIEIRFGDGLKPLKPGEIDTVVIAGMGTNKQRSILAASPEVINRLNYLILQPQGKNKILRRWIADNGWCLFDEDLVFENGHYYFILVACRARSPQYSELELELGPLLLKRQHPLLPGYIMEKMEKIQTAIDQLNYSPNREAGLRRQTLSRQLKDLGEVLLCLQNAKKS